MKLKTFAATLFSLALVASGTPPPAAAQQVITLENGDRISGTLRAVVDGAWRFSFLGSEQEIPAAEILSVTSEVPFGLRLSDGSIVTATFAEAEDAIRLNFDDGTSTTVSPSDIVAIGPPDDLAAVAPLEIGLFSPLLRFWQARGSFGFSDKSGNSRARGLNLALEFARNTERDRLEFTFGLNREDKRGESGEFENTVSNYYASARTDVFLGPSLFVFASAHFQRDTFQDISLGTRYNGGAGVQAVANSNTDLRFSLSVGVREENFGSGGDETDVVTGAESTLRQSLGVANLTWRLSWIGNVGDLADYRVRSDAALIIGVIRGLGFRLGLLDQLNNRPQPGVDRHDLLITTTLTYALGG